MIYLIEVVDDVRHVFTLSELRRKSSTIQVLSCVCQLPSDILPSAQMNAQSVGYLQRETLGNLDATQTDHAKFAPARHRSHKTKKNTYKIKVI